MSFIKISEAILKQDDEKRSSTYTYTKEERNYKYINGANTQNNGF